MLRDIISTRDYIFAQFNFITELLIIYEMSILNNKEITFSEYVKNTNLYYIIHKIILENKINKKEFWMVNQESFDSDEKKFKWKIIMRKK